MPQRSVFDTRNLGTSRRGGLPDDGHARATGLTAMNAVLNEDRSCRGREQAIRIASVLALALLCPALLWCAAYGTTPLVRGGYALMAVGTAVLVSTELIYMAWSRQALPGPADARSHLQKT